MQNKYTDISIENNSYSEQELKVEISTNLPNYSENNPKHLQNIATKLRKAGISCDILHGELVGVGGDLSWSQKPSSSKRVYYFNKE